MFYLNTSYIIYFFLDNMCIVVQFSHFYSHDSNVLLLRFSVCSHFFPRLKNKLCTSSLLLHPIRPTQHIVAVVQVHHNFIFRYPRMTPLKAPSSFCCLLLYHLHSCSSTREDPLNTLLL